MRTFSHKDKEKDKSRPFLCQSKKEPPLNDFGCQDTSTGKGWCSTATDKSGYHESGKGSWGECNLLTSAGFSSRSGHNCNFSVSSGVLLFVHITLFFHKWSALATRTCLTVFVILYFSISSGLLL